MKAPDNSLSKDERLHGKSAVAELLREGRWGSEGGVLKYCYCRRRDCGNSRIIVSVPKRFFKRAVRRNLLKRRIREAYRTQKSLTGEMHFDILFQYSSADVADYAAICGEVSRILQKISG